jgi:hypothetical protein
MTIQRLGILAVGILAITGFGAEPAAARQCFWDGSSPICRGKCPRGYDTVARQPCFNGYKVKCCEQLRTRTQG